MWAEHVGEHEPGVVTGCPQQGERAELPFDEVPVGRVVEAPETRRAQYGIPDDQAESISTVGEAIKYIEENAK